MTKQIRNDLLALRRGQQIAHQLAIRFHEAENAYKLQESVNNDMSRAICEAVKKGKSASAANLPEFVLLPDNVVAIIDNVVTFHTTIDAREGIAPEDTRPSSENDPLFGLSDRARACVQRLDLHTKEQVREALLCKRLNTRDVRNYGRITHAEVCEWAGFPRPADLRAATNSLKYP